MTVAVGFLLQSEFIKTLPSGTLTILLPLWRDMLNLTILRPDLTKIIKISLGSEKS